MCKLPEAFNATCRDDDGKVIPVPHGGGEVACGTPWLLPLLAVDELQPLKQTQEPHHLEPRKHVGKRMPAGCGLCGGTATSQLAELIINFAALHLLVQAEQPGEGRG